MRPRQIISSYFIFFAQHDTSNAMTEEVRATVTLFRGRQPIALSSSLLKTQFD